MRTLLALCKLDCYKLLTYKWWLLFFTLAIVVSLFTIPQLALYFCVMLTYFINASLISLDEQSHGNYLYSALPASRKQTVVARFLMYFMTFTALYALFGVLALLSPAADSGLILLLSAECLLSLLFCGFIQALCFRFHYNTMRFVSVFIIAAIFSTAGSIGHLAGFMSPIPATLATIIIGALFIFLLLYLLLILLGHMLYAHKDFTD